MAHPRAIPVSGFERFIISFLVSLPLALSVGTFFLIAYGGELGFRGFVASLFSKTVYYTLMGALGSYLIKEAGPVKAYLTLGIVLLAIDFLYKFLINVAFDIAFIASMIIVLEASQEAS
ncbi:hypothetical protein EYM_04065 [Ignicoccus islandicus DSM 13165]|uniref:Uncharacterized protein n=1 Tax=Ignicoccus islandicus DSM 13165 TaxID=940295 RepID=A0A0U3EAY4_9CREN|nr:hypothetical protein [Ignicoccus islandicus]ALU12462.1 hypothetical protein EYM_04065 [Ignicoccus islandicus DSM 13165]